MRPASPGIERYARRRGPRRRTATERRRRMPSAIRTAPRAAASAVAPARSAPRRGAAGPRARAACRRRRGAAAGRVDGLLAGRRNFRLVLFQALQRRRSAGRHAGADLLIIGAACAADRGNLRICRLLRLARLPQLWAPQPEPRLRPAWPELAAGADFVFGAAAAGASTARTAVWQPDERLDMFFCRHCSDAAPPGGMLAQCAS